MNRSKIAALAATMLFVAAPAVAQQQQAPAQTRQIPIVVPQGGMGQFAWENERRTAIARAHAGKVQWERATQVASLINANRCKDAYLLAVDERDETLAKRVYEVCTAPRSSLD